MNAPSSTTSKQNPAPTPAKTADTAPQNGTEPKKSKEEWQQERADRFHRVASRRTNQAISALRKLARTGSKQTYYYTDAEKEKILSAMRTEYHALEAAFASSADTDNEPAFTF